MSERMMQFRIGVTMAAAGMILLILLVLFNPRLTLLQSASVVKIRFPAAPGVAPNTPVKKLGILVGRVTRVEFTDDNSAVLVTTSLDPRMPVLQNEVARIKTGLLGDSELEFVVGGDPEAPAEPIPNGSIVQGRAPADPMAAFDSITESVGDIGVVIESVRQTSDAIGDLARGLNQVIGTQDPEQLQTLVQAAQRATINIEGITARVNELLSDDELIAGLKDSGSKLPQTIDETIATLQTIQAAGEEARASLAGLRQFSESLGEVGPDAIKDLRDSVGNLNRLATAVTQLAEAANDPEGPVRKLLSDQEVYREVRITLNNVAHISQDARALTQRGVLMWDDLAPKIMHITSNVAEFTGKLAQDPSVVLSNALQRREGVTATGLPNTASGGVFNR